MDKKNSDVNLFENKQNGFVQKEFGFPVKRYCLTLELKNEPQLIEEYKNWHSKVWPEVLDGIRKVGILDHEIYIHENTLFMILVTPVDFNFEQQMGKLATLPRQAEWEEFMSKFQKSDPNASSSEKWVLMERIFKLN
jgi:L-rhamnose mutarotase